MLFSRSVSPSPRGRFADRAVPAPPLPASSGGAGLVAGALLDALAGDPRRGHPVALFGRAAAWLERRMYADSRARGVAYAACCVLPAAGLAAAVRPGGTRRVLVTAVTTWAVLGGASLRAEGRAMAGALRAGRLRAARRRLPHLCGRDPEALDAAGLARATVESIAENTCDAAVAPLLWGAVCGVPGLVAYRAVNTLDAMVGHRGPRYGRFGWAAARADDLANWVPARVTGLLAAACAPLVGGSARRALAVLSRDGAAHPSPNAGRCEAAFAGALGVRLGGRNVYGGRVEDRPRLGDGPAPGPVDIGRAVALSRAVTAAAVALAVTARAARAVRVTGGQPGPAMLRGRSARAAGPGTSRGRAGWAARGVRVARRGASR